MFAQTSNGKLVVEAGRRERGAAERLRLSQEVHDVVGHGLAAIQMRAGDALHVHATRTEGLRSALETISRASQDALEDLRANAPLATAAH